MKYTLDADTGNIIATGRWPKTAAGALRESIRKWEKVVLWRKNGLEVKAGADSCALCTIYNPEHMGKSVSCNGCPVKDSTGRRFCERTPYARYIYSPSIANAEAEVAFLKSLLPQRKKAGHR